MNLSIQHWPLISVAVNSSNHNEPHINLSIVPYFFSTNESIHPVVRPHINPSIQSVGQSLSKLFPGQMGCLSSLYQFSVVWRFFSKFRSDAQTSSAAAPPWQDHIHGHRRWGVGIHKSSRGFGFSAVRYLNCYSNCSNHRRSLASCPLRTTDISCHTSHWLTLLSHSPPFHSLPWHFIYRLKPFLLL